MKTAVIICEYNPFHSGHKLLVDFARSFCDNVVCVMSGNFVQRGMPAVCNKYLRAAHAIKGGADLVVELPTVYATASAEIFALGGVKIANLLGANYLVFGSECGDIAALEKCAKLLDDRKVNETIRNHLASGVSYPKAVALATESNLLEKPNNTLAVEYLRAIAKTNSSVVPKTLVREDNFSGKAGQYASSTALRQQPKLRQQFSYPFVEKDIDDTIEPKYCQFVTSFLARAEKQQLVNIAEITEGLHNRIFEADKLHGFEEMMSQIKSKRYTRSKLQRALLNCVLGITKDLQAQAKCAIPTVRVLAVKTDKTALLANNAITSTTATVDELDLITSRADRLYSTFDGQNSKCALQKID